MSTQPLFLSLLRIHPFVRDNLDSLKGLDESPQQILIRPFIPGYRNDQFIVVIFPTDLMLYWKHFGEDAELSISATFNKEDLLDFIDYIYSLICISETIVQIRFNKGRYEILLSETQRKSKLLKNQLERNLPGFKGWEDVFGRI